jgi:hypothetical protein
MQENESQELDNEELPESVVSQPERDIEKEKLEASIKNRLKVERQKTEAETKRAEGLAKQLNELQRKFESGKATSEESAEYVSTNNVEQEARSKGIPPEALPGIIEEHLQIQKLQTNVADAAEKDPELKSLLNDPNSLKKVSEEELMLLKHLDNAPAVFKHLLKDPRDLQTFKAAERAWGNGDGGVAFMTFINNLSRQLDSTAKYPHPPRYTPSVSLDDVGAPDSFNLENYINDNF